MTKAKIVTIKITKPASCELRVPVNEEWISFATHNDDLFMTNYCGYWMRGMEYDKRLGWLVFEHGGEIKAPKETPPAVMQAWRGGATLPKRWHVLNRGAAIFAFGEGVLLKGADWYAASDTDANTYDYVVQMALLGEERYG